MRKFGKFLLVVFFVVLGLSAALMVGCGLHLELSGKGEQGVHLLLAGFLLAWSVGAMANTFVGPRHW